MSASVSGGEGAGRRGTVLAVAGLMLALFLVALDQTVVGTALPKIIAQSPVAAWTSSSGGRSSFERNTGSLK